MTDAVVLSGIGAIMVTLLGISGFFIKRWMDSTETREDRGIMLIERTNDTLEKLNDTMNQINISLETYQATMNMQVESIKEKIELHKEIYVKERKIADKKLDNHETDIQDHSVRITVLEKTKLINK